MSTPIRPADTGPYFFHVSCGGCHQLHAPGEVDHKTGQHAPPLADAGAGYDPALFRRLIRTGADATGRPLGMMKEAMDGGVHDLSDDEIAAIQSYLEKEARHSS